MMRCRRLMLCLAMLGFSTAAMADIRLEVIPLHYRSAAELLPLIQPHLSADATVSGSNDRLLIRADDAEIADVRSLVAVLDTMPRSLQITIRRGGSGNSVRQGIGISKDGGVGLHAHRSESARAEAGQQQIRGLEGRSIEISIRALLPISDRLAWSGRRAAGVIEQIHLVELDGGVYALPRLRNGMVEVDILLQDRAAPHSLSSRRVATTVSGQLGEWIPFATVDAASQEDSRGLVYRSEGARSEAGTLWLRVQTLD